MLACVNICLPVYHLFTLMLYLSAFVGNKCVHYYDNVVLKTLLSLKCNTFITVGSTSVSMMHPSSTMSICNDVQLV